jgi:hypothetical protein
MMRKARPAGLSRRRFEPWSQCRSFGKSSAAFENTLTHYALKVQTAFRPRHIELFTECKAVDEVGRRNAGAAISASLNHLVAINVCLTVIRHIVELVVIEYIRPYPVHQDGVM